MANSKGDIGINVRGVILHTNHATLTRFPESMLAKMFNSENLDETSLMKAGKKDTQGNYLIDPDHGPWTMDHDPEIFRIILANLASEHFIVPAGFPDDMWEALEAETDFFCLTELREQIKMRRPIRLIVEGEEFRTNRGLLSRGGEKLLRIADVSDDSEPIFLERDPTLFKDIMNFVNVGAGDLLEQILRDHELDSKGHLELLEAEATYWDMWDLRAIVQKIIGENNQAGTKEATSNLEANGSIAQEDDNLEANGNLAQEDGNLAANGNLAQEDGNLEANGNLAQEDGIVLPVLDAEELEDVMVHLMEDEIEAQGEIDDQEDEEEENGIYVNAIDMRIDCWRPWTSRGL